MNPLPCPMIQTKYLGPTDTRGSRVVATHLTTRKRITVAWDHALDSLGNHLHAAEQHFAKERQWTIDRCCSVSGGGYLFATTTSYTKKGTK